MSRYSMARRLRIAAALACFAASTATAEAATPRLTISGDMSPCTEMIAYFDAPVFAHVKTSPPEAGAPYSACVATSPTAGVRVSLGTDGPLPPDPAMLPTLTTSTDLSPCTNLVSWMSAPAYLAIESSPPLTGSSHSVCLSTAPGEGVRLTLSLPSSGPIAFSPGTALVPEMGLYADTRPCTQPVADFDMFMDFELSTSPLAPGGRYSVCVRSGESGLPGLRVEISTPTSGLTFNPYQLPTFRTSPDLTPCTEHRADLPGALKVSTTPSGTAREHSVCVTTIDPTTGGEFGTRLQFTQPTDLPIRFEG